MNFTTLTIAITALTASPALFAGSQGSTSFDFDRINATIDEAMRGTIADDAKIDKFTYAFDANLTSVDEDRYGVRMGLAGEAPWSSQGFDANAVLVLDHDPAGRSGIIKIGVDAEIKTDTLAMIRHLGADNPLCPVSDQVTGILRVDMTEDCKASARLAEVDSLDSLYQILRDHIDSALVAFSDYRTDLQSALEGATSESLRHTLEEQIKATDDWIQAARNAQLTRTSDGVRLVMSNFSFLGLAAVKNFEMDLRADALRIKCDSQTSLGSSLYVAAKPELLQMLKDMEQGEDYTKRMIQMETRFWVRFLEESFALR